MGMHGATWNMGAANGLRVNKGERLRFGTAEFDSCRMQLSINGTIVETQQKPLEILCVLLSNAGSVVTRKVLFDAVWQGRPTVENVLANAISKLRAALGPVNACHLITHPRVGYSLDCEVQIVREIVPEANHTWPLKPGSYIATPHALCEYPHLFRKTASERQTYFGGVNGGVGYYSFMSHDFRFPLESFSTDSNISGAKVSRISDNLRLTNAERHDEKDCPEITQTGGEEHSFPTCLQNTEQDKDEKRLLQRETGQAAYPFTPSIEAIARRLKCWQLTALLSSLLAITEYFFILQTLRH